jgi:hypothetical protein
MIDKDRLDGDGNSARCPNAHSPGHIVLWIITFCDDATRTSQAASTFSSQVEIGDLS